jgi:hypothetical protein
MVSIVVNRLAEKYSDESGVGITWVYLSQQPSGLRFLNDVFLAILRQLYQKRPDIFTGISGLCDS